MAKTPEGRVKEAAQKIIRSYNAYAFNPVTGGFGVSGLFDQVLCVSGIFVGIEYKKDAKTLPTALQSANAKRCMDSGGVALLIHKDNLHVLDNTLALLKIGGPIAPPGLVAELNKLSVWRAALVPEVSLI